MKLCQHVNGLSNKRKSFETASTVLVLLAPLAYKKDLYRKEFDIWLFFFANINNLFSLRLYKRKLKMCPV